MSRRGQTEFLPGILTDTVGINARFPRTRAFASAAKTARFNVANKLSEQIALHWHGLHLPARMDGGPHQPIAPAAIWQPEFPLLQRAGTYWFHAHQHGKTGEHVWAGMAGVIRVEDDEEASVTCHAVMANDDFILVLQDRRFDAAGQIPYAPNMHDKMAGLQGDQMLVNGQIGPELSVEAASHPICASSMARMARFTASILPMVAGSRKSRRMAGFLRRRSFYQIPCLHQVNGPSFCWTSPTAHQRCFLSSFLVQKRRFPDRTAYVICFA
jgi:blue copper oxidase